MMPTATVKPLLKIGTIERLLLRHVVDPSPERCLIVAMLCQAIADAPKDKEGARGFLLGRRMEAWADLAGINPAFVREVACKSGYLAPLAREA